MSGGVDSSVAAVLLKKQGYNVVGVFLRLWKEKNGRNTEISVKKIADFLKIPLIVIDARKEFKKIVVDYFLREYKAGRTPNPCVVCNREIKFKFLFQELIKLKADYVATGHYARIISDTFPTFGHPFLIKEGMKEVFYKLFTAKDKTKDQSYFLYTLNQKQLSKILFPLENYAKDNVKKLAENFQLINLINNPHKNNNRLRLPSTDSVCSYKESRNICFIPERYPDQFLKRNLKLKPGNIVDWQRNIIGRHLGLPLYTIGQRRNIGIGGTGPYYIAQKNFRKNELIVIKNFNNPLLYKKELFVKNVNWPSDKPKFPLKAKICIRYHHPAVRAIIKTRENLYRIEFKKPQRAVTPGQSAVFYSEKGEVLGGGVIS